MIALTCLGNGAVERLIDDLTNDTIVYLWHSDASEPPRYSDACQNTTVIWEESAGSPGDHANPSWALPVRFIAASNLVRQRRWACYSRWYFFDGYLQTSSMVGRRSPTRDRQADPLREYAVPGTPDLVPPYSPLATAKAPWTTTSSPNAAGMIA
jgi:hypothetical protein